MSSSIPLRVSHDVYARHVQPSAAFHVAQLGVVAGSLGLDIAALSRVITKLPEALGGPLEVAVTGDGTALGVTIPLPAGNTAAYFDPIMAEGVPVGAFERIAAMPGSRYLELRTLPDGRLEIGALAIGPRDASSDLALVRSQGCTDAVVERLTANAAQMVRAEVAAGPCAVRLDPLARVELGRVLHGDETDVAAIVAVATAVNASEPQRALIAKVHATLAEGRGCAFSVVARPDQLIAARLRYPLTSWDTVLRFVAGLLGGDADASKRLGTFAGATGAHRASYLELTLGATEPPTVWVGGALAYPAT
jgi:hypothetical protein